MLILGFVITFVPLLFIYLIYKDKRSQVTSILKQNSNFKYFSSLLYIRKLYFSLFIVCLHDSPLVLLIILCFGHVFLGLIIYFKKPFEDKFDNRRNIFHEICFFFGTFIIFFLKNQDNYTEQTRINLGFSGIFFFSLIFFVEIYIFLKDTLKQLYILSKKVFFFLKKKLTSVKIIPQKQSQKPQSSFAHLNTQNIQNNSNSTKKNISVSNIENAVNISNA